MKMSAFGELVLLGALWGASFLFMKLGAFEFGAVALVAVRVALAAAVLLPISAAQGLLPVLREHWKAMAIVGIVNSALPFIGFVWAVLSITAGTSSVLNATAPLWAAIVAWAWLGERPDRWRTLGLAVGFAGVMWLAWDKVGTKEGRDAVQVGLAIVACLAATLSYGVAVNFTKKKLTGVPPMAVAAGSQAAAALVIALPALAMWPATPPGARACWAAAALGVLCTALAYVLFFRLIANLGPARAIAVTYLVPLFGVAWGVVFLGEGVTPSMLGAGLVILFGTALATGLLSKPVRQDSCDD
jgi:drug/metabolite transporter (DMT)-like permease